MDDHAGGVEHPPQRERSQPVELLPRELGDVAGVVAGADRRPRPLERGARSRGGEGVRRAGERLVREQPVDRGKVAQLHRAQSRSRAPE